jgi:chaperonin GroEL
VAVVKVGAATETEMKDRKLRLEDAINATKAAVEEGIVPGGGTTLAHLAPSLESWASSTLSGEELVGAQIVTRALTAPLNRIAENAGFNGAVITEQVKEKDFNVGYNAADNTFVDMFAAGIVDPRQGNPFCSAKCCVHRLDGVDHRVHRGGQAGAPGICRGCRGWYGRRL